MASTLDATTALLLAATVSQSFPVTGADSGAVVNEAAAGRTQVAGLVASAVILAVLLFLTVPPRYVPAAAPGAILIKSTVSRWDRRLTVDRKRKADAAPDGGRNSNDRNGRA